MSFSDTASSLIAIVIVVWPMVIPSCFLIIKRKAVRNLIVFWTLSVVGGYFFMIGIPLLLLLFLRIVISTEKLPKALESIASYYWTLLGLAAFVILSLPVISTCLLFKKFSSAHPASRKVNIEGTSGRGTG
jgi:hypothetical protein